MLSIHTTDKRLKMLQEIRDINPETIYIWGNGTYSREIKKYLNDVGGILCRYINIVDDDFFRPDDQDVISFSHFRELEDRNSPIVFGFYNYPVVCEKKKQWLSSYPHMYDFHFAVINGQRLLWNPIETKAKEMEYRKTYELLKDDKSRNVMQCYLNAATTGEFEMLFSECYEEHSYFNSITSDLIIDMLIDCGAYDGDSIHDFIKMFPNYCKIIAFEPDRVNLQKLAARKKKEKIRNLTVVDKGVGLRKETLYFHSTGKSNSFLDETGDSEIQITPLDEFCNQCMGTIMVKMDIEGAELAALQGAEKLIREKHPILTICVYHREEDLIEIPQYIHKIAGEGIYDYYLRFHGLDLAELVFYAIPRASP